MGPLLLPRHVLVEDYMAWLRASETDDSRNRLGLGWERSSPINSLVSLPLLPTLGCSMCRLGCWTRPIPVGYRV